MEVELPPWTP